MANPFIDDLVSRPWNHPSEWMHLFLAIGIGGCFIAACFAIGIYHHNRDLDNSTPNYETVIARIGWIFCITLVVGAVFPGYVAFSDKVFTIPELRQKIAQNYTNYTKIDANNDTNLYLAESNSLGKALSNDAQTQNYKSNQVQLAGLYLSLANTNLTNSELGSLEQVMAFGQQQFTNRTTEVTLKAFYPYVLSNLNGISPLSIFCYALLLLVIPTAPGHFWPWLQKIIADLRPISAAKLLGFAKDVWQRSWNFIVFLFGHRGSFFAFFSLFFSVMVIRRFDLWFRNFGPYFEGRTVFAYSNFDISPKSFIAMHFIDTIELVLEMLVWVKWLKMLVEFEENIKNVDSYAYATSPENLSNLSRLFLQWQVSSILLALPSLAATIFYYDLIFTSHDERYWPQAVQSQLFWAITWIILSLPLLRAHYIWIEAKMDALAIVDDRREFDRRLKKFEALQPISNASLIGSALFAGLSFVLPYFHHFLK